MITLFNTPINSTVIIFLTVVYAVTSSITTFDIRIIQAKRNGTLPPDAPTLPSWVGLIAWIDWGLFLALIFLNWKFAIIVFIVRFILKVLPVLEIIGNVLMSPFKPKK
jgi:hypothetical protein